MNQISKRILAIVLSLSIILCTFAVAVDAKVPSGYTGITPTGDGATDIVAVANAQLGKTGPELGYSVGYQWCAAFVSHCAELAGVSDVIPFNAGVSGLKQGILDAGGKIVTSSPEPGDIIIYHCSSNNKDVHTGIVTESDLSSVEGNFNSKVFSLKYSSSDYFTDEHGHTIKSGIVTRIYVRPAYKKVDTHIHAYVAHHTAPTCTSKGFTLFACACGSEFTGNEMPALGHDYYLSDVVSATCTTDGQSIYTCRRCGNKKATTSDSTGHTQPVWVINKQPTCTVAGEQVGYCTKCGEIIDRKTIAPTDHKNYIWKVDYEPTVDAAGKMSRYCTDCGAVLESKSITLHTHALGYQKVVKEPTCTEAGEKGTFCKICQACYITEPIAATGHTAESDSVWVTKTAATCTKNGSQICYCKNCGENIGTRTVTATGHSEGTWYTVTAATCCEKGKSDCVCSACAEVIGSKDIAPLGHSSGKVVVTTPATCTENGESSLLCSRCNAVLSTAVINAYGHDEGVWSVLSNPTCTVEGEKVCTCTRCSSVIGSEKIAATGHDSGVWKIDHESTADVKGHMSLYCSICNAVLDGKDFDTHEHKEGYRRTLTVPTCTENGEGGIFCEDCGSMFDTYEIPAVNHAYSAWYTNNNGTHSKSCSKCHDVQVQDCVFEKTIIKPTCTTEGYTIYKCQDCGFSYVADFVEPLNHKFGEWEDLADGCTHFRECENCGETEYANHQWESTYNEDSTFCKNGTVSRHCADCGCTETEEACHTSFVSKLFYYPYLFIKTIISKVIYAVSLDWLFPWLTRHVVI